MVRKRNIYRFIITLVSLKFSIFLFAQSPSIEWQNTFGGFGDDFARSIKQTNDGGYIVVGHTMSSDGDISFNHGGRDFWIFKLNNLGIIQWQKTYGGSGYDEAYSVQQTTDGGFIVAGQTDSNDGDVTNYHGGSQNGTSQWQGGDFWLIKVDSLGNLQWQKTYGGSSYEGARSVCQTFDGGYILAGKTASSDGDITSNNGSWDYWVLKTDSNGNLQWQNTYGGSLFDGATSICQTQDGGYCVIGESMSNDGDVTLNHGIYNAKDFWIIKLNNNGLINWEKSIGGNSEEGLPSIKNTKDNGFILAGTTSSDSGDVIGAGSHGGDDCWVVKMDSIGTIIMSKCFGGFGPDYAYDVDQTTDNCFVIAGSSFSTDGDVTGNHGAYDYWVVKIEDNGALKWQKSLGGSYEDYAQSISHTIDGGYVITGGSSSCGGDVTCNHPGSIFVSDFWTVKLLGQISILNKVNPSCGNAVCDGSISFSVTSMNGSPYKVVISNLGCAVADTIFSVSNTIVLNNICSCDSNYVFSFFDSSNVFIHTQKIKFKSIPCVGLNEINKSVGRNVLYPNPTSQGFYMKNILENSIIKIFNLRGKEFYVDKDLNDTSYIHTEHLESGIYIVHLITDGTSSKFKLVILK